MFVCFFTDFSQTTEFMHETSHIQPYASTSGIKISMFGGGGKKERKKGKKVWGNEAVDWNKQFLNKKPEIGQKPEHFSCQNV